MRELRFLDFVLMGSGCKIFLKNPVIKGLNFVSLSCMTSTICLLTYLNSKIGEKGGFASLTEFARYTELFSGLLFILSMNKNRHLFQKVLPLFLQPLDKKQKSSLEKFSFWSMIFVLLTIAQEYLSTTLHVFGIHTIEDWSEVLGDYTRAYHSLNSWFLGGCLFYAFCVKMVHFSEVNYFKDLTEKAASLTSEHVVQQAYERRKLMNERRKLFAPFSYVPLLWFIYLFVKSFVVIIEVLERYDTWSERAWRVLPLAYQIIAISCVIHACDVCTLFSRKQTDAVIMEMMDSGNIQDMDLFVNELKDSSQKEFSVFKTFDINRPFILAFVSSLISFTVLFMDIIYEYIFEESGGEKKDIRKSMNCTCPSTN